MVHISDHTLNIPRTAYREAKTEKEARGAFYSATKRALGKETIVVADGMNYIKGFRYQLYCEAKGVGTGNCVVSPVQCPYTAPPQCLTILGEGQEANKKEVHVGTPIPQCRDINTRLLEDPEQDGGYEPDVFENLVYRYEEPNGMTRWDSPLFTVPYDDEEPPFAAIWEFMIGAEGKTKVVKPNAATALVCILRNLCRYESIRALTGTKAPVIESDFLYELDKITQEVVTAILEWQKDHPGEGGQDLSLGEEIVELPTNPVSLPQLQRIRRQFTNQNRQTQVPKARIRAVFVEYLNSNFG